MYSDTQGLNNHEDSVKGQLEMENLADVKHERGAEAGQTICESRASNSLILGSKSSSHPGHRAMDSKSPKANYSTPVTSSKRTCQVVTVEYENKASTYDHALPTGYFTNPIIASGVMTRQDTSQNCPPQNYPLSPESPINQDMSEFLNLSDTHDTNTATGMESQTSSGDTATGFLYVPMKARPLMSYAEHQRSINSRPGQLIDFD